MEGFPSNESEATYLTEKNLFPDAVIILNVTDDTIIKRLLQPKLDKWRQKMKEKKEKREMKKEKRKKEVVSFY